MYTSKPLRIALAIGLAIYAGVSVAAPVCGRHPAAAPALKRMSAAMAQGRFVAYQPTQIQMHDGQATKADEAGIRADLVALRPRFDGLVTYS